MKKLCFLTVFVICSLLSAEDFYVKNTSQLLSALTEAADNGESDTIVIESGQYMLTDTLSFYSEEPHSIKITGKNDVIFTGNNKIRLIEIVTNNRDADISLENLTIRKGRADYGGGLYAETSNANIEIKSCVFDDNQANFVGGGANLYSTGGNISVKNCIFTNNSSPNTSGYPNGTGGGLFVQTEGEGTKISLTGSVFKDNFAHRDGAAAMLYPLGQYSEVVVRENGFYKNVAGEFGGGCWIRCPAETASVEFSGNTVEGNTAKRAGSGGGLYIQITSGEINVNTNTIKNNAAVWQGGGVWIEHNGGELSFYNNILIDNASEDNGGAANIYLDNGRAKLFNNIFYRNRADSVGGALNIASSGANLAVFNNTFYDNRAQEGSCVYIYLDSSSASADFYNNILYASTAPSLAFSGAKSLTARFCDIEDGKGKPWMGQGSISKEPLFKNPSSLDFSLQDDGRKKSPCIDAGDPSSHPDPDGSRADMGALSFNGR